ncbi:hypothetical protein PoB_005631100 [Plakobranchus ocellatus]|uniref:Uncharacterized protein n=1 Tax=Plakobranchus ocellatus TaxID=259542 RepID=A0AAV4CEM5_9GAST|nr:hypothetical protein PoB_005631100 [Plakobranchus ocellatus]
MRRYKWHGYKITEIEKVRLRLVEEYIQSSTRRSQAFGPSVRPGRWWRGSNQLQKGADSLATVPPTPHKEKVKGRARKPCSMPRRVTTKRQL